jgi:DnaJ-domain-containing protein 1
LLALRDQWELKSRNKVLQNIDQLIEISDVTIELHNLMVEDAENEAIDDMHKVLKGEKPLTIN